MTTATAAPASLSTLLVTKLQRPRLGRDVVSRPRLLDRLREGFEGPLTLVTAPAGFGKTTLIAAALAGFPGPAGWVTVDERDNHLPTFGRHIVGAIRTAFPDACRATLGLLSQPRSPSVDLLARTLANELAELPRGCVLVLDEYEAIRDPIVDALLDALLRHPTSGLHLVIAARARPELSLARLRARGQLAELGAADLRFTRAEGQEFLERSLGIALPDQDAAALEARTEGWVAGLRLLALSVGERRDAAGLLGALGRPGPRAVREFLLDEVLARQPPAVQAFLLETALFDRFCAPLCDAILARPAAGEGSQAVLERLERANLFVVALDEHGGWYRYHGLFRDALRQRLEDEVDAAGRAGLHARASGWFAAQGLVEEAVQHALLAGQIDAAADLVEANTHEALGREEWPRVEQWLRPLRAEQGFRERPGLLLARAWTLHLRYRLDEMPALLAAAEARLGSTPPRPDDAAGRVLWAQIQTLRSGSLIVAGDFQRGLECARYGWEHLPVGYPYARRVAVAYLAIAAQALGQGASARRLLEAAGASALEDETVYANGISFGLMCLDLAAGALHRVEERALQMLPSARERGLKLSAAWIHYLLGRVLYEWDDLVAAEEHFRAVTEHPDGAHFLPLQGSLFGLVLIQEALGRPDRSRAQVQALIDAAPQTWSPPHLAPLRSLRARLALLQGDVGTATRWLPPLDAPPSFQPPFVLEVPEVTLAWVRLALGTEASLREAGAALAGLEQAYTAWHDTPRLAQVLALQALVAQAQGETERALSVLARAVTLAAAGGLVRTFLDFGPPMADLIGRLAARGERSGYLSRLQLAFGPTAAARAPTVPGRHPALVEPLTPREIEVVKLLDRRLANREIAGALHISWQTVAKHTKNIYEKLQVTGRREAVARARELGQLAAE